MGEKSIVLKYKTQRRYCSCCNQKLPQPKMSGDLHFRIMVSDVKDWAGANWVSAAADPEDMNAMVQEFINEIISFWAVDSEACVIVEAIEIVKVKTFILEEVIPRLTDTES